VHKTTPKVFLVARPSINWEGVQQYLELVGGQEHFQRMQEGYQGEQQGSKLVEFMGRLCYRSWKPGLNANVTRVREDRREYLANVLNSQHGSVIEHANYSFVFANVSRVFTHELVRHRVGTAFSQESMRFVRLGDIGFDMPDIFPDDEDGDYLHRQAVDLLEAMEAFQIDAARVNQLDDEGVSFARKKEITSAMRRFAPDGLSTHIGFTANARTLRWLCQLRTHESAEVEIRKVFGMVSTIMAAEEPHLWQDFGISSTGEWVPANRKV
jgi:thymidylate synthase (FAD)